MTLYHYDHCPYCAKARMIFGLKNVSFELKTLANDDEDTPVSLIGKKMVPILIKDDHTAMSESLDIIKWVDENYGSEAIVNYGLPRAEIQNWIQAARNFQYHLAMPRWIQMPLEEFQTESARSYFQNKKEKQNIGSFAQAIEETPKYLKQAEEALNELDKLMLDSKRFYECEVHIDDIHLFAALRNLTTVKNLQWPKNTLNYIQTWSEKSKVNLFFDHAL